jgi:hypothetical protein
LGRDRETTGRSDSRNITIRFWEAAAMGTGERCQFGISRRSGSIEGENPFDEKALDPCERGC